MGEKNGSAKWDNRFLDLAEHIAERWSKDPSTKCGAIITRGKFVASLGYNGFPAGTDDAEEIYADRARKLLSVVHAELNAILSAKQNLTGCTIYVHPMAPCSQCAAAIIQAGIVRVVCRKPDSDTADRWKDSHAEATRTLSQAGVILNTI